MQKWEYIQLPVELKCWLMDDKELYNVKRDYITHYYIAARLDWNIISSEGWEMVTIYNGIAYFKRPIVDTTEIKAFHPITRELVPVARIDAIGEPLDMGDITDKIEFGVEYKDESP